MAVKTVEWIGALDGRLRLIEQTLLPTRFETIDCAKVEEVWDAIKALRVRGAPAIGIAAAYGVALGVRDADEADKKAFFARLKQTAKYLASSRPTAVNLFWALDRMKAAAQKNRRLGVRQIKEVLLAEARAIQREDDLMCHSIGAAGAPLVPEGAGVLTHCNAGGLATSGYGTALAVLFRASEEGKHFKVFADETRPLLQGARLTSWELVQAGIPVDVICDNMAGFLMKQGRIDMVIVGADRIAANGDTANKIGTYSLSVLAKAHGIPFYVAAPSSTFDLGTEDGSEIPIEERGAEEVKCFGGFQTAPEAAGAYNPAFDVTPARNITAIITEKGLIRRPNRKKIAALLGPRCQLTGRKKP